MKILKFIFQHYIYLIKYLQYLYLNHVYYFLFSCLISYRKNYKEIVLENILIFYFNLINFYFIFMLFRIDLYFILYLCCMLICLGLRLDCTNLELPLPINVIRFKTFIKMLRMFLWKLRKI